jgi:Uncharacterized protein conserved in bacteria
MKIFLMKLMKNPFVINILLIFAVLFIVIIGSLKWLDVYTMHNEAVIVPDVKGLTVDDAEAFFKDKKLNYNVVDTVYSNNVAPGAIVELIPNAGSKVKEGRIIFITINAFTTQTGIIPEVKDLSLRQAYALLRARGFTSVEVTYVSGAYKDLAIGVEHVGKSFKNGDRVPLSSSLILKVGNGHSSISIDSLLNVEDTPVESIDSDEENWF